MAWNGPDWQNQCKMTDLAKLPTHSYPGDDDNLPETPQGHGLMGYEDYGRRPMSGVAGEIEDEDVADRMDKSDEEIKSFRQKYGDGYMKPPRGEDF